MKLEKYKNLENELTELQEVLKHSLQNDVLQIKSLVKNCDKFKRLLEDHSNLHKASYVIYSKYMTKEVHDSETFIFIDNVGNTVTYASGRELALYGIIETCENLIEEELPYS